MTDDAMGANGPALPDKPKNRSERWVKTRARRMGLRIEKSRPLDPQNPGCVWWLVVGRVGVILRDAPLADIANFLASDAETIEAAIDLAETIETTARYDVHDADWSRRLNLAVIIQAVAQVSVLGASRARPSTTLRQTLSAQGAPILAALRRCALEDLGQILEIDPLKSLKLRATIQTYAVSEVRRIVAEVVAGELTGDALRARFARLKAEMDAGPQ